MKRVFFAILLLIPCGAFAIDIADCEVIGHQRGNVTDSICKTVEICNQDFADVPDDLKSCLARVQSPEDCVADVAKRNNDIESKNLLYRCPATDMRIAQKNKEKVYANYELVYNDGALINPEDLINDEEYVYLFQGGTDIAGFFKTGSGFQIIGPKGEDGLFMAPFEE